MTILAKAVQPLPRVQPENQPDAISDLEDHIPALQAEPGFRDFLSAVAENSPFLRETMLIEADFLSQTLNHDLEAMIAALIDGTEAAYDGAIGEADLSRILRISKRRLALLLGLADLGRVWTFEKVTRCLSDFADAALLAAVRFSLGEEGKRGKLIIAEGSEPEKDSGLIVLAMGKHGAREVNYSSDIDLICFFDPTFMAGSDTNAFEPAMVRVIKRVVKLMQERTAHGYVFRIDLRLRPDPGATAVAIPVEAALTYYESLGQNWERSAYIKARPVACDQKAAARFLKDLSPFVWRKYMDFAAIADVHAMKRQIHQHKGHGAIAVRGHDVKLGRGGIREIEFFVQTQQLIAGGRNPLLRARATLDMLPLLAGAGWISEATAETLARHYVFLRDVEHRIQMRLDEQTHILPSDDAGFCAVARLSGYISAKAFDEDLRACFEGVSKAYARLFEDAGSSGTDTIALLVDDEARAKTVLSDLGFDNVQQVLTILRGWRQGLYRAIRTKRAQDTLAAIEGKLLEAFGRTAQPDRALFAFDHFLKSLPAGIQLFSLLKANDHLLDLMAQLMGSAPLLSETIARHPHVFDALIDPAFFGSVPDRHEQVRQLATTMGEASDYQDLLDRVRIFTQEQKFLIGTRLLASTISVAESQALYSDLAEVVIEGLLPEVVREVARQHGMVADSAVTVLAMGKLGGREMTPTSDLDIILIYRNKAELSQSDGPRPLPVSQYFARITQRFIAALSAPTGEGIVYPVDMRLRPSGKAGPLATDLEAFCSYQKESAWTWEHMALTRARCIGGSAALRATVTATIEDVLRKPRNEHALRADIIDMSTRLHEAKPTENVWDIKEVPGGLVDIEFLVQYWQLLGAAREDGVLSPNTATALAGAHHAGLVTDQDFEILKEALRLYTALIQLIRLCLDGALTGETLSAALADRFCVAADEPDRERLEARLRETQSSVRKIVSRVLVRPDGHAGADRKREEG